uniref:Family with sequence similarity 53 member A n=1 Tax=Colobus angolensis palliatus TaxID=336983 RepID=A0A2K5HXD7_COLAP
MVTLITEKLQSQSLDDLTCKTEAGPALWLTCLFHCLFVSFLVDQSPWKVLSGGRPVGSQAATRPDFCFLPGLSAAAHTMGLQWRPESPGPGVGLGAASTVDPSESTGSSTAPPTKRHCRSLSEPEELVRCRSPWRPGSSKVWTPVSKRRCNSGGSATLQGSPGAVLPRSAAWLTSPTSPATPRPSSASSGFVDSSEGSAGSGLPWCSAEPHLLSVRRRLSLSQEQLAGVDTPLPSASSSPTSTPELGRHCRLLRCRSQPCVLSGKRSRRKRRREEDARWTRPSLDFLKMTRVSCARECESRVRGLAWLLCHLSGQSIRSRGVTLNQNKMLWFEMEGNLAPEDFKKFKKPLLPQLRR